MTDHLMDTYNRLGPGFISGEGAYLSDNAGRRYLDTLSGVAVCTLGHAHPRVTQAICEQAKKLLHTSNLYPIPLQEELAMALAEKSGMERVFFSNSGAEANEAAIKLARLYGHQKGLQTPVILVMEGGFHGRTMATITASGNKKVQAGFAPLLPGFVHIPFNDIGALRQAIAQYPEAVAVMLEPIQGEGGVIIPDQGYLKSIRSLCDAHELILILDEIQTGMCRTGQWFAYQHEAIIPDIITLAKALGNGLPIGACLARGKCARLFRPGNHGSTFGGNPLVASAALTVINVLTEDKLAARAASLGRQIMQTLTTRLSNQAGIKEIRGKGLMIGIELTKPCTSLPKLALEQGILINVTANNVIRLLPPLIISDEQAETISTCVAKIIGSFLQGD